MSNPDIVQYIVEQASQAGEVNAKKMFGDYDDRDYVSLLVKTVANSISTKRK